MSSFRGFIAADIEVTENIIKFLNEMKNSKFDIKVVEPQNIHITLKFLGDVQQGKINQIEQVIKESVEGIESFKINLKNTGVFPNKNYIKVVWIGIEDAENLAIIANNIDDKLSQMGFKKEKREFSAHLTIARVKTARNKDILLERINEYDNFNFGIQEIKSIKLKMSELTPKGPIYTTLKEVKL